MTDNVNTQLINRPRAINSIGDSVFIKLPFYRSKKQVNVIYINSELYEKVFNKKYDYETAKKDILDKFAVTLEGTNDEEVLGYGYVDKQTDPTDIALNGNKGSGRAFYLYENCNIKGDKTPFATSPRDDYNNGKYTLDSAIQECLISNILNNTPEFNNFETLAIIDTNEKYLFPHVDKPLDCGLIIRYSENNELYRFSHRFTNNKEFTKDELYDISKKIGILEGNKFIHRFLHGAWSIGNLSTNVNMIDLDTSFYVKGRHPQWSYTDKYITNFFGFEQYGQLKVIETIINSNLNIDNVSIDELKEIIENNRKIAIRKGFAKLIGYDENIYNKYSEQLDKLADEFSYLSQIMYDNYDNLNCVDENCQKTNIFDFSHFFRYYEIYKQKGIFDTNIGLSILLNNNADSLKYTYNNEDYHSKIKGFFEKIIVDNTGKYFECLNRVINFINSFDSLNEMIDINENIDKNKKLVKTYVENEDKKYLLARKWMRQELILLYREKGENIANEILNSIIDVYTNKNSRGNNYLRDLYIFTTGYIYRDINTEGYYQYHLKMFNKQKVDRILMRLNGHSSLLKSDDYINYTSERLDNKKLEDICEVSLIIENKIINTTELGIDNPKRECVVCQSNDDYSDITTEDIIEELKNNYNINVSSIEEILGGTEKCYCISDDKKKYFLKEFIFGENYESIIQEYQILEELNNSGIPIANFIKTKNNKLAVEYKGCLMILQEFVEGKTYHNEPLPKELLYKSASLLGEIHSALINKFSLDNTDLWTNINIVKEAKEIDYLLNEIEKIKDDPNYEILKETLDYKKQMLGELTSYNNMFSNLSYNMTHGDYSKRQLIFDSNETPIAIDFSSSLVAPVVWEIIRSYILSTLTYENNDDFDYDMFVNYIKVYMNSINLSKEDISMMPYTLIYQCIIDKNGYLEYIKSHNQEKVDFIRWKYNICKCLEKDADNIVNEVINHCIKK